MNILLIYALLASVVSYYGNSCELHTADDLVNAAIYEQRFHELFHQYWQQNGTGTDALRKLVKVLRQKNLKIEDLPDCLSPKKCLLCRAFSYSALTSYRNNSDLNLADYLHHLCTVLTKTQENVCRGLADIFAPSIKYILNHRSDELSSDRICGIILLYNKCSPNESLIDFTIKSDHATTLQGPKRYHFDEKSMNSSSFLTIAHLSDFHYDPYYIVDSSSDCAEDMCCRNTSTPNSGSIRKAGYWGDYGDCDSPGYLVENICSQVAANHKNIDLIYYTGDFTDHFEWLTTKSTVRQSIEFVTQQIKGKFPNVPVVMVIGNHDIHPSDMFAPNSVNDDIVSSKWLYGIVADLWSDWLPEAALSTLRTHGYYSFVFRPGFRIIVLNNNYCHTHNIWLLYDANEMVNHLEWLRDTLIVAEASSEKVHILGHQPANVRSCIHAWNREYNKLIRQFAHIISGQFTGHTHNDEFALVYSTDPTPAAVSVSWNGGSGTAYGAVNSNYRIYTAELNTFEVVDHETYIFNLTDANLAPGQPPTWFKEYSFRDAFGVADLSPFTLSKLVNTTFRHDRQALYRVIEHYSSCGPTNTNNPMQYWQRVAMMNAWKGYA